MKSAAEKTDTNSSVDISADMKAGYYTLTIVVVNNIDVLCFYIFSVLTSDYTVWLDC